MNFSMGSTFAFAGRWKPAEHWWHLSAWWALVLAQILVVEPISAFLFVNYPEWSILYALNGLELDLAWRIALATSSIAFAFIGFALTHQLLLARRVLLSVALAFFGVASAALIAFSFADALDVIQAPDAFELHPNATRRLRDTSLVYHLAAAAIALVLTWTGSLRCLRVVVGNSPEKVDDEDEECSARTHI